MLWRLYAAWTRMVHTILVRTVVAVLTRRQIESVLRGSRKSQFENDRGTGWTTVSVVARFVANHAVMQRALATRIANRLQVSCAPALTFSARTPQQPPRGTVGCTGREPPARPTIEMSVHHCDVVSLAMAEVQRRELTNRDVLQMSGV